MAEERREDVEKGAMRSLSRTNMYILNQIKYYFNYFAKEKYRYT